MCTHFPKDRNCDVCLRIQVTTASCRRRTGEALHRAEKFGDLITADHTVFNEGCESRNNLRYAVVVQDLATQDSILSVQNKDFTEETEKSLRKFLDPSHKPQVIFFSDNSLEFANLVKIYDGIIDLQHLIDPRHMALLKEPYEEWKKELQQYCYSQAWMKNVVAGSMECYCHLRKVQDLLADGKAPYERLFWEPFERPFLTMVLNGIRFQHEINQYFINLARQFYQESFLGVHWSHWILERRCSDCGSGRIGKVGRIRNLCSKNQRERRIDITKGRRIHIPSCRWHSEIVRKIPRIPRTHTTCKERRPQWRASRRTRRSSTDRIKRWRWSLCRLLVCSRWLHLTSSRGTPEFNSICRREKHSLFHWNTLM